MEAKTSSMFDAVDNFHGVIASNSSHSQYAGPISCVMFFPQGEMLQENIPTFGPDDNRPFYWSPSTILSWPDGSVKRAQVKTVFTLGPNDISYVKFASGKTPVESWVWDQELFNKLVNNSIQSQTFIQCNVNGVASYAHPFSGDYKILRADACSLYIRFRSHFHSGFPAQISPLSLTTYVELEYLSPIIKTTFVLGNDTLEVPVNGGLDINGFQINSLLQFSAFQQSSYGSLNFSLADGQTMAIRCIFSGRDDAWAISNLNALSESLVCGFDYYPTVRDSKAMGLAPLPPARFGDNQILEAKAQVDNSVWFPSAEAKANTVPGRDTPWHAVGQWLRVRDHQ